MILSIDIITAVCILILVYILVEALVRRKLNRKIMSLNEINTTLNERYDLILSEFNLLQIKNSIDALKSGTLTITKIFSTLDNMPFTDRVEFRKELYSIRDLHLGSQHALLEKFSNLLTKKVGYTVQIKSTI